MCSFSLSVCWPSRLQERPDILVVVSSSFCCAACACLFGLSSPFAPQRVSGCISDSREACHSLASSLAKETRKSSEDRPRERSRGTQNRMKIDPGNLSGHPMPPKSVPEASRERLGSVPERPQRTPGVPGGSPRAPRDARKGALERLGARRADQNRRQAASGNKKFELSWHGSLADRFSVDFRPIFDRFSDVRARRSGSALAANFDRFSVRAREA